MRAHQGEFLEDWLEVPCAWDRKGELGKQPPSAQAVSSLPVADIPLACVTWSGISQSNHIHVMLDKSPDNHPWV